MRDEFSRAEMAVVPAGRGRGDGGARDRDWDLVCGPGFVAADGGGRDPGVRREARDEYGVPDSSRAMGRQTVIVCVRAADVVMSFAILGLLLAWVLL